MLGSKARNTQQADHGRRRTRVACKAKSLKRHSRVDSRRRRSRIYTDRANIELAKRERIGEARLGDESISRGLGFGSYLSSAAGQPSQRLTFDRCGAVQSEPSCACH